jgi:hypothetical protein
MAFQLKRSDAEGPFTKALVMTEARRFGSGKSEILVAGHLCPFIPSHIEGCGNGSKATVMLAFGRSARL